MSARLESVVKVYMTPADLHEIAERMSNLFKTMKCGDSLLVKPWFGDNVNVEFYLDQERMQKQAGRVGNS